MRRSGVTGHGALCAEDREHIKTEVKESLLDQEDGSGHLEQIPQPDSVDRLWMEQIDRVRSTLMTQKQSKT